MMLGLIRFRGETKDKMNHDKRELIQGYKKAIKLNPDLEEGLRHTINDFARNHFPKKVRKDS